jgi:ribonuclease HI
MFLIQFDACNRETIGIASIGFVLYYDSVTMYKHSSLIYDHVPDSNYAEYKALIEALKFALKFDIKDLQIEGDAKIVLLQINDKCNVKSDSIKPLLYEAKELVKNFKNINFEHIYRKRNIVADSLANKALYNYMK